MCVAASCVVAATPAVEGDALRHLSSSTSSSDSPSSSFLFHRGVLASEASDSKAYAEKATAYAVTLLLIWFTFAGVYCMVSMPFKQDTLLYGRSKVGVLLVSYLRFLDTQPTHVPPRCGLLDRCKRRV